jgi:transcriptional regulator with XRE-family HTH domain
MKGVLLMSTDESIRAIFKDNLNKLFEEKCTTQKALADFLGVSGTTISDWRKGKKMPRMDKIDKICQFFHVDRSDLLNTFNYDDKDALKKYASYHPVSLHRAEYSAIEGNNGYVKFKPKDKVVCDIADSMQKILNAITKENMEHPPAITEAEQALLDAYRNAPADKKTIVNLTLGLTRTD